MKHGRALNRLETERIAMESAPSPSLHWDESKVDHCARRVRGDLKSRGTGMNRMKGNAFPCAHLFIPFIPFIPVSKAFHELNPCRNALSWSAAWH